MQKVVCYIAIKFYTSQLRKLQRILSTGVREAGLYKVTVNMLSVMRDEYNVKHLIYCWADIAHMHAMC